MAERYHNDTGGSSYDYTHDIMTYGLVYYGATNATGSFTFNLRGNEALRLKQSLEQQLHLLFFSINNTGRYLTAFKIDGSTQTVQWNGGSTVFIRIWRYRRIYFPNFGRFIFICCSRNYNFD